MADRLHLEIVTPSRRVVEAEVDEVRLPGALGEMGVLPGHIPLLTSLAAGPLTYFAGSQVTRYAVRGGFAEVLPDRVTVLAAVAEAPADIDLDAARGRLQAAQEKLKSATAEDLDELTTEVRLAETEIEVAGGGAH
ncbi:MAG: F0F1 ATP synthase subunit epsilon [Thermoanaerobaculales bacterium]|jgi:F-type H+-transporting ATPase subunit epsilon|nr:F0F1 ATP synthase subunit epsilon [Thermoanaerobaculales bacterium]